MAKQEKYKPKKFLSIFWCLSPPGGSVGKESTYNAGDAGDTGSIPGSGRFPWRRAWQPTLVFLPGESHGQRSLVGYGSQGHRESDKTEVTEHAPLTLHCRSTFMHQPGFTHWQKYMLNQEGQYSCSINNAIR